MVQQHRSTTRSSGGLARVGRDGGVGVAPELAQELAEVWGASSS
jgi:hypothetical protein